MTEAIELVYYIFNKIVDFLFNSAYIVEGVSLGWIVIVVSLFIILINSVLNTPQGLIRGAVQRKQTAEYRSFIRDNYNNRGNKNG